MLAAAGADVNVPDRGACLWLWPRLSAPHHPSLPAAGWTPLFCAAIHQHEATIRALVAAKADLTLRDKLGYTARKYCTADTTAKLAEILGEVESMPTSPRSPRS